MSRGYYTVPSRCKGGAARQTVRSRGDQMSLCGVQRMVLFGSRNNTVGPVVFDCGVKTSQQTPQPGAISGSIIYQNRDAALMGDPNTDLGLLDEAKTQHNDEEGCRCTLRDGQGSISIPDRALIVGHICPPRPASCYAYLRCSGVSERPADDVRCAVRRMF
jgi:hypothetical protein